MSHTLPPILSHETLQLGLVRLLRVSLEQSPSKMRSLTTLKLDRLSVADFIPSGKVSAVVVDPETHGLYVGVERTDGEGVEVDLLRLSKGEGSAWNVDVSLNRTHD